MASILLSGRLADATAFAQQSEVIAMNETPKPREEPTPNPSIDDPQPEHAPELPPMRDPKDPPTRSREPQREDRRPPTE
jgi:hypothetical protein